MEYKYSDLTGKVIGAAMEVHRELGCGFQEVIYRRSYAIELENVVEKVEREVDTLVYYKGIVVGSRRVDFLINGCLCIEIKAIANLEDVHLAQALNYLEAFNFEVGLLINFGSKTLEVKRLYNKKYISGIVNPTLQSDKSVI